MVDSDGMCASCKCSGMACFQAGLALKATLADSDESFRSLSFLLGDKRLSGVPVHVGSVGLQRDAEPTSLRAPRGPSGRAGGGTEA